jgi:hypothetical protein
MSIFIYDDFCSEEAQDTFRLSFFPTRIFRIAQGDVDGEGNLHKNVPLSEEYFEYSFCRRRCHCPMSIISSGSMNSLCLLLTQCLNMQVK